MSGTVKHTVSIEICKANTNIKTDVQKWVNRQDNKVFVTRVRKLVEYQDKLIPHKEDYDEKWVVGFFSHYTKHTD
jgi:hypothetical protein